MGPACAFDADARSAFAALVREGFVDGILAGNALATHDLEAGYRGTALGQDVYTQRSVPNGHYNHIDTINEVRRLGSIQAFVDSGEVRDGILYECVKKSAARSIWKCVRGAERHAGPGAESHHDHLYGVDSAYGGHGKYDPLLSGGERFGAAPLFLLSGYLGVRRQ